MVIPASFRSTLLLSLLLAAATVALYAPVRSHPFFNMDDQLYVSQNAHVQNGLSWKTAKWAFTSVEAYNWHPLTWLSHALDYQIYGLNPGGHHETNVLLHALDAVLLFWVLRRATGYTGRSFMVAALFALHPINVEAVAWVAERKTMLSMLFLLLALAAYLRYALRPSLGRYLLVALLYALGLMSKPQIITLPLLLLLWDYWPLQRMFAPSRSAPAEPASRPACPGRSLSWLVVEKLPLLVLCAASAALTMYAQGRTRSQTWGYTFPVRLQNAVVSYARYLGKAFWPMALAPEYPHPGLSLRPVQVWGAAAILLAVSALVALGWRRRYLVVGWLWFLVTLVPMIGLVQVGQQAMADRYAYGAFVGLFIMVCWGFADLSARVFNPRESRAKAGKWPASVVWQSGIGLAVLLALSAVTYRQIGYWKDTLTLWRHASAVVPNHWAAEDNLGVALQSMGRPEEEFMPHFFKATEMRASDPLSNMHVAAYEQAHGNPRQAIVHYRRVLLNSSPPSVEAGIYQDMGLAYQQLGDPAQAQECFDRAVTLRLAAAQAKPSPPTKAKSP